MDFLKFQETDVIEDENVKLEIVVADSGIVWGHAIVQGQEVPLRGW